MMSRLMSLLVYFIIFFTPPSWCQDVPMVMTHQGLVRGSWATDGDYSMFLGITYAVVNPDNPFGDALQAPIYDDVFDANDDSARCPQVDGMSGTVMGTLNCLNVNVYVPRSASLSNPLPVMVWVHGGGFRMGSSGRQMNGPMYLVRHDVIVVTVNYRLGVYGFMCLDIPSVPGNAGLKDQRRALEWVKNNIAAFGGDTNSITAFGQSAGAMSLQFQILSPGSNGLFHRAILQSGSALVEEVVIHSRPSAPQELVEHFYGTIPDTVEEALEQLKYITTLNVVLAAQSLGITFKPCVEKAFEDVENIITDYPDNVLASGEYEIRPLIVGYTSDENLANHVSSMYQENYFDRQQNIVFRKINASFEFPTEEQLDRVTRIFQEFYFGTKPISEETVFSLVDFDSDAHFLNPIERSLSYHITKTNVPIYQYVFDYNGEINLIKSSRNITVGGAAHSDEIAYLFSQTRNVQINSEDQRVIDQMTTMWTNFAKYRDPTPEVTELLPVRWPTVTEEREYLLIDSDLQVDRKPFHSRIAFWDLIFNKYGEYFRMVWSSCQGCPNE